MQPQLSGPVGNKYKIVQACLVYGTFSFIVSIINKNIGVQYSQLNPLITVMTQCFTGTFMSVCMISLESTELCRGIFKNTGIEVPNWRKVISNMNTGMRLGIVGIFPVATGGFALFHTSMPLYIAFRKCDIVTTIILQYLWCGEQPQKRVLASAVLIITGSVIAVFDSLNTNIVGLLCVWSYNAAASFQKVYLKAQSKKTNITAFESNFYFCCMGSIVLATYNFLITDNYAPLIELYKDPIFLKNAVLQSVFGHVFSISIAVATTTAGPIALSITAVLKDGFLTYAGFILFDDSKVTALVLIGITFSFMGALLCIYTKLSAPSNINTKTAMKVHMKD